MGFFVFVLGSSRKLQVEQTFLLSLLVLLKVLGEM